MYEASLASLRASGNIWMRVPEFLSDAWANESLSRVMKPTCRYSRSSQREIRSLTFFKCFGLLSKVEAVATMARNCKSQDRPSS